MFPTKLPDAAVMLRPSFVDDDVDDATERRPKIQTWLNEVLEACVGEPSLAVFLGREGRVAEYTALVRCVLQPELPVAAAAAVVVVLNGDSSSHSEADGDDAVDEEGSAPAVSENDELCI